MKTYSRTFPAKLLQASVIVLAGVAATASSARTYPPKCGGAASGWAQFTSAPTEPPAGNLCQMGTPSASPATLNASGDYQWSCVIAATPTDPVQSKVCFGPVQKEDGKCGAANNTTVANATANAPAIPKNSLCASNALASAVLSAVSTAGVTQYTWTCPGIKGGTAMTCHAHGPKPKLTETTPQDSTARGIKDNAIKAVCAWGEDRNGHCKPNPN